MKIDIRVISAMYKSDVLLVIIRSHHIQSSHRERFRHVPPSPDSDFRYYYNNVAVIDFILIIEKHYTNIVYTVNNNEL